MYTMQLLGVVLLVLQVAAPESQEVTVSVRPPGSNIYLGECVMLLCAVESNSTSVKNYLWFRSQKHSAPNPRHLVSRDSYYITAVTVEDADKYWCQAECRGNRSVYVVEARPVTLTVSDLSPPTLSLTPNARHMLGGERFTLQCPTSQTDSSSWKLMHFLPGNSTGTTVVSAHHLTPGGGVPAKNSDVLMFIAAGRNSGLYWCEGPAGRSNAVYITVSYGTIILKTPAFPVVEGETVSLYCQYQRGSHTKTSFFKNGEEIKKITTATSGRVTTMVIRNVTRDDEGFYRCASQDGKMQSSGSWLSVRPDRGNFTSLEEPPTSSSENAVRDSVLYRGVLKGSWKVIVGSSVAVLLLLTSLVVGLVYYYRYKMICIQSCWPVSKQEKGAQAPPATTQDVTEIQWDLSWMEMSNLLDKDVYCGT